MRAAIYEQRGPARKVLRIVDRRMPEPGPGEVRVKIAVSAVNDSDIKARGVWLGSTQMAFPVITPHQDGAGVIDRVGAGVSPERVGERVWLYMAQRGPMGTAAEFIVMPASCAIELPQTAHFDHGACLGHPAITAHYALFSDGALCAKTVLIHHGAGAIGYYAIQFAKWGGARKVIAMVDRHEAKLEARSAGADFVVNSSDKDMVDAVRVAAGGDEDVDRIIEADLGAHIAVDFAFIARNGVIASVGSDSEAEPMLPYAAFSQKNVTLRTARASEAPAFAREAAIRDINRLLETGSLRHQAAVHYTLDQIAEAHEALESRKTVGRVLIALECQ